MLFYNVPIPNTYISFPKQNCKFALNSKYWPLEIAKMKHCTILDVKNISNLLNIWPKWFNWLFWRNYIYIHVYFWHTLGLSLKIAKINIWARLAVKFLQKGSFDPLDLAKIAILILKRTITVWIFVPFSAGCYTYYFPKVSKLLKVWNGSYFTQQVLSPFSVFALGVRV